MNITPVEDPLITVAVYTGCSLSGLGIRAILQNTNNIRLSGTFSDLDTLEGYVRQEAPNIILLELTSAIDLKSIRRIISASPGSSVVLWFDNASEPFLAQGLCAGLRGLLSKSSSIEIHVECLSEVARGVLWVERGAMHYMYSTQTIHLSPRERQLMGLVAQGLANKEIAWSLGITANTVKVYLSNLYTKLNVSDRLELAIVALNNTHSDEKRGTLRSHHPQGDKVKPLYIPPSLCIEGPPGLRAQT